MKLIILLTTAIFSCVGAQAAPEDFITRVTFKDAEKIHEFTLRRIAHGVKYELIFRADSAAPKSIPLSKDQAEGVRSEATRIAWNANYRKPQNLKECHDYSQIVTPSEKATVCSEDIQTTGEARSLLLLLNKNFK